MNACVFLSGVRTAEIPDKFCSVIIRPAARLRRRCAVWVKFAICDCRFTSILDDLIIIIHVIIITTM